MRWLALAVLVWATLLGLAIWHGDREGIGLLGGVAVAAVFVWVFFQDFAIVGRDEWSQVARRVQFFCYICMRPIAEHDAQMTTGEYGRRAARNEPTDDPSEHPFLPFEFAYKHFCARCRRHEFDHDAADHAFVPASG